MQPGVIVQQLFEQKLEGPVAETVITLGKLERTEEWYQCKAWRMHLQRDFMIFWECIPTECKGVEYLWQLGFCPCYES